MSLYSYLARLEDTLRSRRDIDLEYLHLTLMTIGAVIKAEIRFYDGSRLSMVEELEKAGLRDVERIAYKFHYWRADGTLVFRYDNSPHHPHLATFPSHKHAGDSIVEAEAPDLADVLREIYTMIYPA